MEYKRILVIGASGSGKSTYAQMAADKLNLTYIATDPFYWDIDWQLVPDAVVRERVAEALQHPDWVMDGNFDDLRELVWQQADCILWLNLPFLTVLYRVITRNLRWWVTKEAVWSGNRMTLKHGISGVRHAMKSYWKKKRDYPAWLQEVPNVIIFSTSRQGRKWLEDLP
jgi:hypothetical protein